MNLDFMGTFLLNSEPRARHSGPQLRISFYDIRWIKPGVVAGVLLIYG